MEPSCEESILHGTNLFVLRFVHCTKSSDVGKGMAIKMLKVNFYQTAKDELFQFAVIVSRHNGKWVFCKHKERNTYECPGGHREENEPIDKTAERELWEETGAVKFDLKPVCAYSVESGEGETYGMLYFADIFEFGQLPDLEIEKMVLVDELP